MITIGMSTVIEARRERVWRALTRPAEVLGWDDQILSLLEAPEPHPRVGEPIRWRCRLGSVPVELSERPLEIVPLERLHSDVGLGLLHCEEILTLSDHGGGTRLAYRVTGPSSLPVVGGLVDRFDVRRISSSRVDARLRALRDWCEQPPNGRIGPAI